METSLVYNAEVTVTGRKKLNKMEEKNLKDLEEVEKQSNCTFKPNVKEFYTGLTENTMKDRIYKHNYSFRHENKSTTTTLSKYIWKVKHHYYTYDIKWRKLSRART